MPTNLDQLLADYTGNSRRLSAGGKKRRKKSSGKKRRKKSSGKRKRKSSGKRKRKSSRKRKRKSSGKKRRKKSSGKKSVRVRAGGKRKLRAGGKRKLNDFMKMMLGAKKSGEESFQYTRKGKKKSSTYKRIVKLMPQFKGHGKKSSKKTKMVFYKRVGR